VLLVNAQTPFSSTEIVEIVPAVGTVNDDELEDVWLEPTLSAQLEPLSVEQVNVVCALAARPPALNIRVAPRVVTRLRRRRNTTLRREGEKLDDMEFLAGEVVLWALLFARRQLLRQNRISNETFLGVS
jgi:hypothetical protein